MFGSCRLLTACSHVPTYFEFRVAGSEQPKNPARDPAYVDVELLPRAVNVRVSDRLLVEESSQGHTAFCPGGLLTHHRELGFAGEISRPLNQIIDSTNQIRGYRAGHDLRHALRERAIAF